MTDPQHEETFADTERKLREIITTLRAQLAEARAERDVWEIDAKRNHQAAEIEFARADRAEAALAAQIKVDAEIVIGMKGHGWDENPAIHTYDKGYIAACDAAVNRIRNQPRDRTALERHDAKTREKALREAAEILDDEGWLGMSKHRILAMIPKGESHE